MSIVLALTSAFIYGIADYSGGRATRSHPSVVVAFVGQCFSLVLVVIAVVMIGTPFPDGSSLAWGAFGGAAGALALSCFYYALANGSMTVVAPLTAVVGAILPVGVGLALGERPKPLAYAGIALAVVAVAFVSGAVGPRDRVTPRRIIVAAVAAGLGFGTIFVSLERAAEDSGLWPLVAARVVSVPMLGLIVLGSRAKPGPRRAVLWFAVGAGILDMLANVTYLEAVRGGMLSLIAVIGSLYPVSTVGLAFAVDRERVTRWQAGGMIVAVAALVLVTLGRG